MGAQVRRIGGGTPLPVIGTGEAAIAGLKIPMIRLQIPSPGAPLELHRAQIQGRIGQDSRVDDLATASDAHRANGELEGNRGAGGDVPGPDDGVCLRVIGTGTRVTG